MQPRKAQHLASGDEGQDVLPDQVLVSVLELIPRHNVLASAALVNKRWLRVATSKDLWSSKMSPVLSKGCGGLAGSLSWGQVYYAVYQTNLLANPYLEPPFQKGQQAVSPGSWTVTSQGGSGWAWEELPNMGDCNCTFMPGSPISGLLECRRGGRRAPPPLPCPPYSDRDCKEVQPAVRAVAGAVASSYRWCELVQVVDLLDELVRRGLSHQAAKAFLDSSPPLSFSVWYAARADCPADCEARILLTAASPAFVPTPPSDDEDVGGLHAAGAEPPGPHLANPAARLWGWTTGSVQPAKGAWQRAHCVAAGYPAGARCAVVVLRGRDRRFWAGHWGAKLAAPSLRFLAPEELEALGAPEG